VSVYRWRTRQIFYNKTHHLKQYTVLPFIKKRKRARVAQSKSTGRGLRTRRLVLRETKEKQKQKMGKKGQEDEKMKDNKER